MQLCVELPGDWLQCLQRNGKPSRRGICQHRRTKALQSRERDSFVGPQEAVAIERRALWRGIEFGTQGLDMGPKG